MAPNSGIHGLFRRHVALPAEHGAWVFLLTPLLLGLFATPVFTIASLWVVLGALGGFLVRQPITLLVRIGSGRRGRDVLPPALFWLAGYGGIAAASAVLLARDGHGRVLWLALPALPVLARHLWLVGRRAERRRMGVEIAGSGALALAAPAALWVGVDAADPGGWWLWLLAWAQSAASIVHAFLRLEQREAGEPTEALRRTGRAALALASAAVALAIALGAAQLVPRWVFAAHLAQWAEVVRGLLRPAYGLKPKAIGYRQLAVSILFTVVFIVAWRL